MGMNKRAKFDSLISLSRLRSIQVLTGLLFLYLVFITFEIPMVLKAGLGLESPEVESSLPLISHPTFGAQNDNQFSKKEKEPLVFRKQERKMGEFKKISGLIFDENAFNSISKDEFSELHRVVRDAFVLGKKVLEDLKEMMVIPCGLSLGSHITIVGRPRWAHKVSESKIALAKDGESTMVSQFIMELQGLRAVDGEDPPRILHFNPRLKGDWSGRPVIEQNTCYRMQWGTAQRCEGWKSRADEETVVNALRNDVLDHGWWMKCEVLYTGFTLEDATGLFLNGDVDIHSIVAASLPASHPSTAPRKHLELSAKWKAPNLPTEPVELFIGILSAGNHFAGGWRKEVNVELMKEAEYFGDIVIVPYMDNYDLVVLKTIAICEYGVRTVAAKYIMKCDDDTFVRIDTVMMEVNKIEMVEVFTLEISTTITSLYGMEWPEEDYPPYANGPGYIVSSDIAQHVVSEFEKHKLRLFKMEDVSMGMWVEQFNSSRPVEHVHSLKFSDSFWLESSTFSQAVSHILKLSCPTGFSEYELDGYEIKANFNIKFLLSKLME
ncbi:hypothetical protein DH2020_003436 [Rehmannia glutinosa]|uniref:Galectin domain-containing protein n=1 Tax=Rehmannia glutinosa TaxID=99300 RepID=A0ABR0XLS8_REHGL